MFWSELVSAQETLRSDLNPSVFSYGFRTLVISAKPMLTLKNLTYSGYKKKSIPSRDLLCPAYKIALNIHGMKAAIV
ncbi:hypothetical protein RRG08_051703 [Elysia crispata]|uniref:Uncharacterized protein n=1 Tax=Elysia crispata TaxID=231223 RepID=A0AAE1EEH0_9GAST|nr:hypothetical protein RRG08_051703 [Elysia crispata]